MKCSRLLLRGALAAGALLCSVAAQAADWRPQGAYVQYGHGKHHTGSGGHHTTSYTAGLVWPWQWQHAAGPGAFTGSTEAFISYWRAEDFDGGHQGYTQLGILPLLRYQFAPSGPTWFVEGGVGATWMDKIYHTPQRRFSTSGNFIDVLAFGRSFGTDGRHELSLRAVHFSNCDIKKPNPGEEFLQLRYTAKF